MKGKRYTTEQKIRILREAENSDKTIQDVCRERQISEQTFHRDSTELAEVWKREMGMLQVDQAKQLKELQRENARLKRMLADEMLGKELLKEALEKSHEPRSQATDCRRACDWGPLHRPSGLPALWTASQHFRLRSEATGCMAGKAESCPATSLQSTSRDGLSQNYEVAQG